MKREFSPSEKGKRGVDFRTGFAIYIGLLTAILLFFLTALWFNMSRYQRTQDALAYEKAASRAPQLAFERFVAESDGAVWAQCWFSDHPESYDDFDRVAEALGERVKACSLHRAESFTEQTPAYTLFDGDTLLATVTMEGEGLDWRVAGVTTELPGEYSDSIIVPSGARALCNGKLLDASLAEETESDYDLRFCAEQLIAPRQWYRYSVGGQMFPPELRAEGENGVHLLCEGGRWLPVLDEESAAPFREESVRFAERLLTYFIRGANNTDANMKSAARFVRYPSRAYDTIIGAKDGVIWGTPYDITESRYEASLPVVLADNCFVIDISFHALGRAGSYENLVDGVYRVYYIDNGRGDGYRIENLFLS